MKSQSMIATQSAITMEAWVVDTTQHMQLMTMVYGVITMTAV